jgi:hypothetical protein
VHCLRECEVVNIPCIRTPTVNTVHWHTGVRKVKAVAKAHAC